MDYNKNKKLAAFETRFKSKIIKEISKLHYCLKRILINIKTINNSDDLTYSIYFTLKEVFNHIKAISLNKNNNMNYYGYDFNESLIEDINKLNISKKFGKDLFNNSMVYYIKYNDNSISIIIIEKDELDEKKDLQILTTFKHISNLANFNNTTLAA